MNLFTTHGAFKLYSTRHAFPSFAQPLGWTKRRAGVVLLVAVHILAFGCATSQDLQKVRTEIGEELRSTRTELDRVGRSSDQKVEAVARDLQTMQSELQELSSMQKVGIADVRKDVESGMSRLQERITDLGKVRQELEGVQADIALLKPLGMALDSVQERLAATTFVIESLKVEAQEYQGALAGMEEEVEEMKILQGDIATETARIQTVVGEISQSVVQRLRIEMNLTRDRLQQLQKVLDRFPVIPEEDSAAIHTGPSPG